MSRAALVITSAMAVVGCGRMNFSEGTDGGADASGGDSSGSATVLVSDDFQRVVMGGWGPADIGGTWVVYNPNAATVAVSGSSGTVEATTTTTYADVSVMSAHAQDVQVRALVAFSRVPASGHYTMQVVVRWIASSTSYGLKISLMPLGTLEGKLVAITPAGGEVTLTTPSNVLLGIGAGEHIAMSLRATGVTPTTLCGRVWRATDPEPSACTLMAQDSTPVLQAPGRSFVTFNVVGAEVPATFSVFSYRFVQLGAP